MAPHEQRVVDEKEALEDKVRKLEVFIQTNETYTSLENMDKLLLAMQLSTMQTYAAILATRISRFGE